jgi:hypothetical protein
MVACGYNVLERNNVDPIPCDADAAPQHLERFCLAAPSDGGTCSETYEEKCVVQLARCSSVLLCGPFFDDLGRCCYTVAPVPCPPGRPFVVDGRARMAVASDDATWAETSELQVGSLDAATRAALSEVWTQDALAEHASVASFSRFVLQCLAVGAPADIVRDAQKACAEEIEHARIGFGLASAYAGRVVGPGPLDIQGALDGATDPVEIACSVAREGCIAETVSASLIAIARDAARDPVVKALLGRIAEQEYEHALLAWRYLRWALEQGDRVLHDEVARVFEHTEDHVALGAHTTIAAPADVMRAHGYLSLDERRRLATRLLAEVIRPAAMQVLYAKPAATRVERVA